ncbi:hypothetical protein, partial [Salmonella sp. s54412]|uniref:hypothetical protein n=1 Tax=Salmonella sp. s54412 TaxID=3160128 RepID=UPI0037550C66
GNQVILLVVDDECDQYYRNLGVKIPQDKFDTVSPKDASPVIEEPIANGDDEEKQQNGEILETEPAPAEVPEPELPDEKSVEVITEDDDDAYEEVIPLSSNNESQEKPAETP